MDTNVKKFLEEKSKFEQAEKYNVQMKLNYLISQIHTLFDIINDQLGLVDDILEQTEETNEIMLEKFDDNIEPANNFEQINKLEEGQETFEEIQPEQIDVMDEVQAQNIQSEDAILDKLIEEASGLEEYVDIENVTLESICKEELDVWGLDLEYAGCKYIIDLVNTAPELGLTVDSTYDEICEKIAKDDVAGFKRAITFIRKKAIFKNSRYLTILSVMKPEDITNEVLLKNFIELCY